MAGKKISPARYYEPEWEAGAADQSSVAIGRNGVPDIARGLNMRLVNFTLSWMSEAEWETSISPLAQAVGKTDPVFCCFDPAATTYRQNRTYFGRFTDNLRGTKKNYDRFERQFELLSMI